MSVHEARHLLPGDVFRDDGRLLRVTRIAVSPDAVEINAEILIEGTVRGSAMVQTPAATLIRISEAPPVQAPAQRHLLTA